jgi:sortase A
MRNRRESYRRHESNRFALLVQVTGEFLLTLGLVAALYFAWTLTLGDWGSSNQQLSAALRKASEWDQVHRSHSPAEGEDSQASDLERETAPVLESPAEGEVFALLRIPRFGDDFVRQIAHGISYAGVLNSPEIGVGHYPQSADLGEPGNFALAGHRLGYGGAFSDLVDLRMGDRIYIETIGGWYSYEFRNLEFVLPGETSVLNSFPKLEIDSPQHRMITLTTCNPEFSVAERVIAYGVLDGWYPREDLPPSELNLGGG